MKPFLYIVNTYTAFLLLPSRMSISLQFFQQFRSNTDPVVCHGKYKSILGLLCSNQNIPFLRPILQPMDNRIFHKRLQNHGWNILVQAVRGNIQPVLKPGLESDFLDLQVIGECLDFRCERDGLGHNGQAVTEQPGEAVQHVLCEGGRLNNRHGGNRIQCIIQKMRIDLHQKILQF